MAENADAVRRRTGRVVEKSEGVVGRSSALQELLKLKRNGGKRIDNFEVKLEDNVCDTLSEADYDRYVAQRREEAKEFVVDDDGVGYLDGEDEDDWASGQSDDEGGEITKQKKVRADLEKKKRVSKAATELAAAAALTGRRRVTSMFAEASVSAFGRRPRNKSSLTSRVGATTESILDDVLAGITPDDVDRERESKRRLDVRPEKKPGPQAVEARHGLRRPNLGNEIKAVRRHQVTAPRVTLPDPPHQAQEYSKSPDNVVPDDTHMPDSPVQAIEDGSTRSQEAVLPSVEQELAEVASIPVKAEMVEKFQQTSLVETSAEVKVEQIEVPIGLNAVVAEPPSFGEEESAPWHAIVEGVDTEAEYGIKKGEPPEDVFVPDSNALPVDSDGKILFYLIDAYEEEYGPSPGTVYLFGKVKTADSNRYMSCCVVVQNVQRCLFAVPAPSVFSDSSLPELEEAAKAGGDAEELALSKKLQDLARGMKAELAEKLMERHVDRFTMFPVKRSYSFDRADVPTGEHYFLKLSYPFKNPPLQNDLQGRYFTNLFGTHTSALELFLIKRRIRGPCWLSISNPTVCSGSAQVSWCKIEINLSSPKDVAVTPASKVPAEIPQLVVAAINLKTLINPKDNVNEVVSASVVYIRQVKVDMPMALKDWNTSEMLNHFSVVRKLTGGIFPVGFTSEVSRVNDRFGSSVITHESSERALLNFVMMKLHQLDPDVLVGHNISGFDLDVLLHRLQACKVQSKTWSKVGRLRRSQMPRLGGGGNTFGSGAGPGHMACIAGRLLCDTYLSSRELLKETSYSLTELSRTRLGRQRKELAPSDIPKMFESASTLMELMQSGETDAWLALGLMFHLSILPLTRQLTNISGNLWSKTLQGNRAQRVEYLLLHEFYGRKFILPDKLSSRGNDRTVNKRKPAPGPETEDVLVADDGVEAEDPQTNAAKRKKGAAYLGGLVLEPKKGLYDKFVLLLDFNSLYPSIIQEYNICFTTIEKPSDGSIPRLPSTQFQGILPQVLKGLVDRRKQVKNLLKRTTDGLKYQQFDIQQQALKLTANSIYGCLGFTSARFYAKPIAELITSQGREILQSTVDLVQQNLNLEVIYGDTDSIMIHSGLDDVNAAKALAAKAIKEVNKKYKLLEIDLDGIYKRLLLLKKKKYAAVKVDIRSDGTLLEVVEQKGLDIVRRDWSLLSKDIGNFVLEQILSGGSREDVVDAIHDELRKLQEDLRNGKVDLAKFIINKTLTKSPEDYPDAKSQPHVQVALRRRQGGHSVGCSAGDTVPYIICIERGIKGASSLSLAERARHPDEVRTNNEDWSVDIEYYISQQIRPVVSRLCDPIEGTNPAHIAECLGLDPSKFQQTQASNDRDEALLTSATYLDDDDRYRHCEELQLVCPHCTTRFPFLGVGHVLGDPEAAPSAAPSAAGAGRPDGSPNARRADDLLRCPECSRAGSPLRLSPAMLANQVKLRSDEFLCRYYDGVMSCDEDSCGLVTRNVSLRVVGDAERGTVCPNYPRCNGSLVRAYTEADLYKQLTHFLRLLDVSRALDKITDFDARMAAEIKLATVLPALKGAAQTVNKIRDRSGFRWVNLAALCVTVS